MTLGEYVRQVMKEKHLSAMKVQKNSGGAISDTYVLKIRSGKVKRPSLSRLKALAKGLKEPEERVLAFAGAEVEEKQWTAQRLADVMVKMVESSDLRDAVEILATKKPEDLRAALKGLKRRRPSV
jgi:transcriptional regulator with XRE-family HTH domain